MAALPLNDNGAFHLDAGVAGSFNAQQLDTLGSCMPPDSIQYCETDRPLQKAEGRETDWVSNEDGNTDNTADSSAVDVFGRRRLQQQQPKSQPKWRPQLGNWRQALRSVAARLRSGRRLSDKSSAEPMMSIKDAAGPTGAQSVFHIRCRLSQPPITLTALQLRSTRSLNAAKHHSFVFVACASRQLTLI